MMFNAQNIKSEAPMLAKRFVFVGDGTSVIRVALDKSPVAMTFIGGKTPFFAMLRGSQGSNAEVWLSMEGVVLKFEFPVPPAPGERVEVDVEFFYEGEFNGKA